MTDKTTKSETKADPTVTNQTVELTIEDRRILKAIDEKAKNNPTLKLRLLALYNYSMIESEQSDRMTKDLDVLNLKYNQLSTPLYARMNDVVNGKPLMNLDLYNYEAYLSKPELEKKEQFSKDPKPISDYWYRALKHNATTMHEIKPHDIQPLQALTRIEYLPSNNINSPHDFILRFYFSPNDYFENTEFVKRFYMINENEVERIECTKIIWKPGKNIAVKNIKKIQKNRKTGASRTIEKTVERESFFTFFKTMERTAKPHAEESDDEEDEVDDIERHLDIAFAIVDEVLPRSNEYYLGVRKENDLGFLKENPTIQEVDDDDEQTGKESKIKK